VLKPAGPFKILFHHRDLKRPLNVDSRRRLKRLKRANSGY